MHTVQTSGDTQQRNCCTCITSEITLLRKSGQSKRARLLIHRRLRASAKYYCTPYKEWASKRARALLVTMKETYFWPLPTKQAWLQLFPFWCCKFEIYPLGSHHSTLGKCSTKKPNTQIHTHIHNNSMVSFVRVQCNQTSIVLVFQSSIYIIL